MQAMRVIQNTEIIKDRIRECSRLAKEADNINQDESAVQERFINELDKEYLTLEFVKFLVTFWNKHSNESIHLNELLVNNVLYLPKYEPPPVDPAYEERMRKLRQHLDEEEYQRMVANVDLNSRYRRNNEKVALFPEFKTLQGQLVAIFNIVATIGGAFFFGFKAVEYSLDTPDIIKQMFAGLILAVIVAIADFYFLFKKLMNLEEKEINGKKKTN